MEPEAKDSIATRKVQKADREKLRRDRLNEQFLELGHVLDPDRPKNDKATILAETIQLLKDLTAQVNRLKAEFTSLSEESDELTQEKNELREEKASLKSEIDNLNVQYQQRFRLMYPWNIETPVVMSPPPYPYPMPMAVHTALFPMHPSLRQFPFVSQNTGVLTSPCPAFVPYHVDQPTSQYMTTQTQAGNKYPAENNQDSKNKSLDSQRGRCTEKAEHSDDIATDLELKIPGLTRSSNPGSLADQLSSSGNGNSKQCSSLGNEGYATEGSCWSRGSHAWTRKDSSTSSAENGSVTNI